LVQVGTIELRPGIEPTTRHLEELVRQMRVANARIVLREPYVSRRIPDQVAAAVDGVVVTLPIMVGGVKEAGTYIQMMDYLLDSLTAAAAGRKR
jgi:ABC-type Zn uptake system ZnuABC Zn-binding protein ZnuA